MLIGGYHREQRDWRDTTTQRGGDLIGIELEVEHPYSRQEAADALDTLDPGEYPHPVAERDGSLNELLGVEIICPPLPLDEVRKEGGYVSRLMTSLRNAGVQSQQRNGVGMHVNINVSDWTPKEKILTQWCLNAFELTTESVGKRNGHGTFGGFRPVFNYRHTQDRSIGLNTFPGGKHAAAWLRSAGNGFPAGRGDARVLEARFPRSSLEIKDLHAAIDYVYAVRDWIRAAPNHTEAAILLTVVVGKPVVMEGLFHLWANKHRPVRSSVSDELAAHKGMEALKGKRLEVATKIYEDTKEELANGAGFRTTEHGDKEQILRVSTLIGKGAELEGESVAVHSNVTGRVIGHSLDPHSIRARR